MTIKKLCPFQSLRFTFFVSKLKQRNAKTGFSFVSVLGWFQFCLKTETKTETEVSC